MSREPAGPPTIVDKAKFCDQLHSFFARQRYDNCVVAVDIDASSFDQDLFLTIRMPSLEDTFSLLNTFPLQSLPPHTRLIHLPAIDAIDFWRNEDTRKRVGVRPLDAALNNIRFVCEPPHRESLQLMDISPLIKRPSLETLAALKFSFTVRTPVNHPYSMYITMTEGVSLGRLLGRKSLLQGMWQAMSREETWMDRSTFL